MGGNIFGKQVSLLKLMMYSGIIIDEFDSNDSIMEKDTKNKPTDEALKSENPGNRDFQRTEDQTDRVSQSEIDEKKREKTQVVK